MLNASCSIARRVTDTPAPVLVVGDTPGSRQRRSVDNDNGAIAIRETLLPERNVSCPIVSRLINSSADISTLGFDVTSWLEIAELPGNADCPAEPVVRPNADASYAQQLFPAHSIRPTAV